MSHDENSSIWKRMFGLDTRSLAIFRIALALLLLIDLGMRWQYRDAFFSENGVLPLALQGELIESIAGYRGPLSWSLHTLSGSNAWMYVLFGLTLASYLTLIAGFRTRIASIAAWVLLTSWHVRNPMIMHSGDTLLRIALFWSMFLPLGEVWSMDSRRARRAGRRTFSGEIVSPATAGLIMLLVSLYLFSGIAKLTPRWIDGSAMEYVLRLDIYATHFGRWLLQFPGILKMITWATVGMELFVAVLILSPWRNRTLRIGAMIAFMCFHAGIASAMSLGLFQYAAMMIWLALIPGSLWERATRQRVVVPAAIPARNTGSTGVWPSRVIFATSLFFVFYFLCWHVANIKEAPWSRYAMPGPLRQIGRMLNTRQEFRMFDYPPVYSCWFVYDARLANGTNMDIFRNQPVSTERPASILATMPSIYWRQLHRNLLPNRPVYDRIREQTARSVVNSWNATHGKHEQVMSMRLTAWLDEIVPYSSEPSGQLRHVWAQVGEQAAENDLFDDLYRQLRETGEILP